MLTQTIRRTPTFSCRASLISWIPVLLMNSGSSNGGFSIPLFPCRYFRLKHQCLGTGTVFLVAFKCTSSLGSWAVTSCISTTSGRATNWSEVAAGEIKSYHLFRIRHGLLDWKHKPYIFTCLSSATVSRFILLSFFLDSFGASGLISCTWETFQMFSTWAGKYSYFLLRSRKKNGGVQTSSLSSLSFFSSSNPFFRSTAVSCFSDLSGSFSFSFFTSSVS